MGELHLTLLGGFEARGAAGQIDIPARKGRALLAYLALRPGKPVPRNKLASLLWSDRGDKQAHGSLRQTLTALRKALGTVKPSPLLIDRTSVALTETLVDVDAVSFAELSVSEEPADTESAAALYRGDLLEGLAIRDPVFQAWLDEERRRLREEMCRVLERLLEHNSAVGELDRAVEAARLLLNMDGLHERVHRALMRLYALQGHREAALQQYQHCRELLDRELGVEPEPETIALADTIGRGTAASGGTVPRSPTESALKQDTAASVEATPAVEADTSGPKPSSAEAGRPWRWKMMVAVMLLAAGGAALVSLRLWAPALETASVERMALPLPDEPSLAVLPFANLSSDPAQQHFIDGITSDLITDLSRHRNLFVIAANSSFSYKGKSAKVHQVAEDLGVRYVLNGSVQRSGKQIRINAQLVDALTGHHIWTQRYEREAGDLFAIQGDIVIAITQALAIQNVEGAIERSLLKRTDSLEAYDYYWRSIQAWRGWTKEANFEARQLLEEAIALDPNFALAYGQLGWIHLNDWIYEWSDDPDRSRDLAIEFAQKSSAMDPDSYDSHWTLARVYFFMKDFDRGLAEFERATALNPNDPYLLAHMASFLAFVGRSKEAVQKLQKAVRIDPRHPQWFDWILARALYMSEENEEALAVLKKVSNPTPAVRRLLAAVLVRLGRPAEARAEVEASMKSDPEFKISKVSKMPFKYQSDLDRFVEDLRRAGVPE